MTFIAIAYQDIKERQVYWFLFPIIGVVTALLHYNATLPEQFKTSLLTNLGFVGLLIIVMYAYARLKMKTQFKQVIGLGDILLFIALATSFSIVSFIIIFISALIFSLVLHLVLNKKTQHTTVPLAGYMSLFFIMTYIAYWLDFTNVLYIL